MKQLLITAILFCLVLNGCNMPATDPPPDTSGVSASLLPLPTPTPIPTPSASKPSPEPAQTPTPPPPPDWPVIDPDQDISELPYYIYIEKGSYTINIYGKDQYGYYTEFINSYRTAIGKTLGRTPTGIFKIGRKKRWHAFSGGGYAQYTASFYGGLLIHSPLYGSKNNKNLWRKYYTDIGTMATGGCLRTTTEASFWIYNNCPEGTIVEIVNGSPRGTTSEAPPPIDPDYPRMDPTDPEKPPSDYDTQIQDTRAPVFKQLSVSAAGSTIKLSAMISEYGMIYYIVVPEDAAEPSPEQVKSGTDYPGASVLFSGKGSAFSGHEIASGLSPGSAYTVYLAAQDEAEPPNLQSSVKKKTVTAKNTDK